MKKIKVLNIVIIFVALVCMFSCLNITEASSIGLYVPTTSITVGNSITVTVSGDDAIGRVDIYSSNSNVAYVNTSSLWVEGSASFTITAQAVGNATITISPVDMATASGDVANVAAKSITVYSQAVYVDNRSTNNNLSSITIEGYELDFNKDNTSYTLDVDYEVEKLNVSASTEDYKASVNVENPEKLEPGENIVKISVTAENQTVKTYEIKVNKAKNPDDINAKLKSLKVINTGIKNIFSPDTLEYLCEDITADVDVLVIEYETEIEGAKVEIIGNEKLEQGINHVKVKVTSKDESEVKEYDIIVFKSNQIAALVDIPEEEEFDIVNWIKENKIVALCIVVIFILLIVVIILLIKNSKNKKSYDDEELDSEELDIKKHRRNPNADKNVAEQEVEIKQDIEQEENVIEQEDNIENIIENQEVKEQDQEEEIKEEQVEETHEEEQVESEVESQETNEKQEDQDFLQDENMTLEDSNKEISLADEIANEELKKQSGSDNQE